MRRIVLLPLLFLTLPADARKKTPSQPLVPKVPSIEEVVTAEGFTPTPSQSDIYKPGSVLVPNGRGGHDVVVSGCIAAEPEIAIMSQSSIATTLSGGVSARLGVARGAASGSIEKRLSFVDPEQRTISLGLLKATASCAEQVETAARFKDLSSAIVLYDVLVAIIKNSVCTKADASGGVVALGAVEAAAFSECVIESDGLVPLGYKSVPLDKVLAVASAAVDFGIDAQLAEQEQACVEDAQAKGSAARASRLAGEERDARAQAGQAWRDLQGDLEKCTQLPQAQRGQCVTAAEQWLSQARSMPVSIPAGVEPVETACGLKQPVFAADLRTVMAEEVAVAEAMLVRLEAPDGAAPGKAGIEWVRIPGGSFEMGSAVASDEQPVHSVTVPGFELMKTEVTVGQYRACVEAGACSAPDDTSDSEYCNWGQSGREDHPINCVDWNQATTFATWAGARLPTEAEWEYAARSGGQAQTYPWGNEAASCSRAVMDDGGDGCGEDHTWPVCSKPAGNSTQGVCDLAGNVWEWTQDTWHGTYRGAPGDGRAWEGGASYRVSRGGGWYRSASLLRASYRFRYGPSFRFNGLGFRLAR